MHQILDVPEGEKISSKYSSGEKLAKALMSKVGNEKEVTGMLAFAANISSEKDIFDSALSFMKQIEPQNESVDGIGEAGMRYGAFRY